jgi:hypothetical protein
MPFGHQLAAAGANQGGRRGAGRRAMARRPAGTVFSRARKEKVPTILDADLGPAKRLAASSSSPIMPSSVRHPCASSHRRLSDSERLGHVLVAGSQACRRDARSRGLSLARARRSGPLCPRSASA